ncbi:hypothetical protein [Dietzia sp. CH92]|uniref:hypothetical protein n=1 Tax=Dietzia sp. CH92 TaxID=3051823 RepID=UPI0028D2BAAF|nr:hypothetical protein [Dietzia sp. CH92]
MSHRHRLAALVVPLVVLAGCSADQTAQDGATTTEASAAAVESSASPAGTAGGDEGAPGRCGASDAEMAVVSAAGEPTLEVPQPAGWERNSQLDSELVRQALVNPGLAASGFAPNVVVTAEPSPADVEAAFDRQIAAMRASGASEPALERGQVCGFESMTVRHVLPEMGTVPQRPAVVQIIVVPAGAETVTYTMTAQATEPLDPAYERDVAEMFAGVRIS